ncbi:MAG: hypothetical protein ABH849_02920 [Nanoarchaeota archaeon]
MITRIIMSILAILVRIGEIFKKYPIPSTILAFVLLNKFFFKAPVLEIPYKNEIEMGLLIACGAYMVIDFLLSPKNKY